MDHNSSALSLLALHYANCDTLQLVTLLDSHHAAVAVDGRGMNNALAYPGIFKGTLDARAKRITPQMKNAAAYALADAAKEQLLPDMLDQSMHTRVAKAVAEAWRESQ